MGRCTSNTILVMAKLLQRRFDPSKAYCLEYDEFVKLCQRVQLIRHGLPPLPDNKDRSGLKEHRGGDLKLTVFSEINGHKVEMELVMFEYEIHASMTLNEGVLSALAPVNRVLLRDFIEDPDGAPERITVQETGHLLMYGNRQGNGNPPFIETFVSNARLMRELFFTMFGLPVDAEFPPLTGRALKRMRRQ